jgi:polyisoprenoid-binding protein YceI
MRAAACSACLSCLAVAACHEPATFNRPRAPSVSAPPAASMALNERYRIDPEGSQVLILVYRDGPMAALGHNHVLSVRDLSGELTLPAGAELTQASFTLAFPVAAIAIDDSRLRGQQGVEFAGTIDAGAIEGTRTHMLGESLLDAAHYARIELRSGPVRAEGDHWLAQVHIRVRDQEALAEVPVRLEAAGDSLICSGAFELTHAQLGLKPYSVALGALRVAESLHVSYRLIAERR